MSDVRTGMDGPISKLPISPPARTILVAASDAQDKPDVKGYYDNYVEYSRIFRTWLVAYGVGAPVIFLTNDALLLVVARSLQGPRIISMFLFGVFLQVSLALLNKWCAWHQYAEVHDESLSENWRFKLWDKIGHMVWLDFFVDLASLAAFIYATWLAFCAYLSSVTQIPAG